VEGLENREDYLRVAQWLAHFMDHSSGNGLDLAHSQVPIT
jgi:hypothetical protein